MIYDFVFGGNVLTLASFLQKRKFMKYIARLILKMFGWKLKGSLPVDKKAVVISVPHTYIMDFIW